MIQILHDSLYIILPLLIGFWYRKSIIKSTEPFQRDAGLGRAIGSMLDSLFKWHRKPGRLETCYHKRALNETNGHAPRELNVA